MLDGRRADDRTGEEGAVGVPESGENDTEGLAGGGEKIAQACKVAGVVTMIRMAPTKRPKITAQKVTTTTFASVIQRRARSHQGAGVPGWSGPAPGCFLSLLGRTLSPGETSAVVTSCAPPRSKSAVDLSLPASHLAPLAFGMPRPSVTARPLTQALPAGTASRVAVSARSLSIAPVLYARHHQADLVTRDSVGRCQ